MPKKKKRKTWTEKTSKGGRWKLAKVEVDKDEYQYYLMFNYNGYWTIRDCFADEDEAFRKFRIKEKYEGVDYGPVSNIQEKQPNSN